MNITIYLSGLFFFTVLFQDSNPQTLKNALFVLSAHSAVAWCDLLTAPPLKKMELNKILN